MRNSLKVHIGLFVLLVFALSCSADKKKNERTENRPNFVFILVDDQTFDALGHVGRYPFLKTPNLDQLITEGTYFSNAFVTHSLCSPSRASFLTGTHSFTHGITSNRPDTDPDWTETPSYAQILHENGYETGFIGKMHMAHLTGQDQPRPGYDYWLGFKGQGDYQDPQLNENGNDYKAQGYITDILTDSTIAWIKNKRDVSKPFSISLFHKAIHGPFIPAARHQDKFLNNELIPPSTYNQSYKGKPEWYQRRTAWRNEKQRWENAFEPTPDEIPQIPWENEIADAKHSNMLKCLLAVDESVGKIRKVLREKNLLDNTVIIYSSDNGYYLGDHSMRDKRSAYEPSMRVPLVISYPKLIGTKQIDKMVLNIDVAPTILDLAGIKIPDNMQGKSMVPLFNEDNEPWREDFLFVYYRDILKYHMVIPDMLAVRTDTFKYMEYPHSKRQIPELYDLLEDLDESKNLALLPDYETILNDMQNRMRNLKNSSGYKDDRDWLPRIRGLETKVLWNWQQHRLEPLDSVPFD